ncbi:unnamed protein product, partial [marine sediment metagenome]
MVNIKGNKVGYCLEFVGGTTHQEINMYEERRKEGNYNVEELGIGLVRLAGGVTF